MDSIERKKILLNKNFKNNIIVNERKKENYSSLKKEIEKIKKYLFK